MSVAQFLVDKVEKSKAKVVFLTRIKHEQGANVNHVDKTQNSVFSWAASKGHQACAWLVYVDLFFFIVLLCC